MSADPKRLLFNGKGDALGWGGHLTRGDIEDWLAEKLPEEESRQDSILRWAKIAGWVSSSA